MDIKLFHNPGLLNLGQFDIKRDGLLLVTDDTLETAVTIALFTNRRPRQEDITKGLSASQGGWFGDALADLPGDEYGSYLWTLYREKAVDETLNLAREYCIQALQWLLEDGIAELVNVQTRYTDQTNGVMEIFIDIKKLDGSRERYNLLWSHLQPQQDEVPFTEEDVYLLAESGDTLLASTGEGLLLE